MSVELRNLFFRGEVGSREPSVAEGELRGPTDGGEDGGVAIFRVEVATGLAKDSGLDVVACGCDGGVFDSFADFVAREGAVVVVVIGQEERFVGVCFLGFFVAWVPLDEKVFLEPKIPLGSRWQF